MVARKLGKYINVLAINRISLGKRLDWGCFWLLGEDWLQE
tara:strand:- start:420 stop:539 length:120 start_codon:yes stop_codon:yes gene_type:complete